MISALPSVPTFTGLLETLVVTAAPAASFDKQLTVIFHVGAGLIPATAGFGKAGSTTSPSTSTSTSPSARSRASASPITQGAPPPGMPRIGLAVPVYGALTPISTFDLKTVWFRWPAWEIPPVTAMTLATTSDAPAIRRPRDFTIYPLSVTRGRARHRSR